MSDDPRLVFIHGIGPLREPVTELNKWKEALAEGMRSAGHSRLATRLIDGSSITCTFAHYADLFAPAPAEPPEPVEALLADALVEVIDERLGTPADPDEPDGDDDADTTARLAGAREQLRPTGVAQGTGNIGRWLLNACTTLLSIPGLSRAGRWASGKLMVRDLAQVTRYLARAEPDGRGDPLDDRIRARVAGALGPGPAIVVAHSLGTIVAFEVLHAHGGPVPLWVTLGSPLGLRTVVLPRLRPRPPATPAAVHRWLNYWDRDDLITARTDLAGDFAPNAAGVTARSCRVDSDGLWVHPATTYLRKADVAGPIAEAIGDLTGPP